MPLCLKRRDCRMRRKELKLAEVIEPSNLELERQQAYVALDLQEWKAGR